MFVLRFCLHIHWCVHVTHTHSFMYANLTIQSANFRTYILEINNSFTDTSTRYPVLPSFYLYTNTLLSSFNPDQHASSLTLIIPVSHASPSRCVSWRLHLRHPNPSPQIVQLFPSSFSSRLWHLHLSFLHLLFIFSHFTAFPSIFQPFFFFSPLHAAKSWTQAKHSAILPRDQGAERVHILNSLSKIFTIICKFYNPELN